MKIKLNKKVLGLIVLSTLLLSMTFSKALSPDKQKYFDNLIKNTSLSPQEKVNILINDVKNKKITPEDFAHYYADKTGVNYWTIVSRISSDFSDIINNLGTKDASFSDLVDKVSTLESKLGVKRDGGTSGGTRKGTSGGTRKGTSGGTGGKATGTPATTTGTGGGTIRGGTGGGGGQSLPQTSVEIPNPVKHSTFQELLMAVLEFLQYVGAVIAILSLIAAAFKFMTAEGDPQKVKQGFQMIFWTIVGLFVIISARAFIEFLRSRIGTRQ
jgi:hypothetical protein